MKFRKFHMKLRKLYMKLGILICICENSKYFLITLFSSKVKAKVKFLAIHFDKKNVIKKIFVVSISFGIFSISKKILNFILNFLKLNKI